MEIKDLHRKKMKQNKFIIIIEKIKIKPVISGKSTDRRVITQ